MSVSLAVFQKKTVGMNNCNLRTKIKILLNLFKYLILQYFHNTSVDENVECGRFIFPLSQPSSAIYA